MPPAITDTQRQTLRLLCDTFVPRIKAPLDPSGFWARTASDLGADNEIAAFLTTGAPPELKTGLLALLDALAATGFCKADQARREAALTHIYSARSDAARALTFFEKQTLQLTYGLPAAPPADPNTVTYGSPSGQNPMWETLGYPGPVSVPPIRPKRIRTVTPAGDAVTLDADVCIVGSGAGGSVVAARLSALGWKVVVLEAGGHYSSADFHQLELWGYRHLWYRGGATPTANGTVSMLAGGTLGGGTEINWMNCVRTPDVVRHDWATNFGITGADSSEFDRYLDSVGTRISSGTQTALYNSQNLRMREGCQKLGYLSTQTHVNWKPELFNPLMAGYTGFGDQTGGKQTARRTFLQDAYEHGAQILVNCHASTVLVSQGRATGVQATYTAPDGHQTKVKVNARAVVVSCGSLESPALLLRSGIGGPAVGKNLHLQPGGAIYGVYPEKQKGWWGSPMTANCEQFTNLGDGYGFYMEIPAFGPGFVASVIPWKHGLQHKQLMTQVPNISTFIWFLRDKGAGQVTIDRNGQSVATYQLSDAVDQKNFRRAASEAIRIHQAAGAKQILVSTAHDQLVWKGPGRLEDFIRNVVKQPVTDGNQPMISAHQLSTCRMGKDRNDSVANPDGELHGVKGVWIADASACPTALGANPMVTIMALAARTADRIAASSPRVDTVSPVLRALSIATAVRVPVAAATSLVSAVAMATIGMMTSPFQSLLTTMIGSTAAPEPVAAGPMYTHLIELTARPGQGRNLVNAIRDLAIPGIRRTAPGFVDELVLQSETSPESVSALSFWRSKQDGERFYANGFNHVSEQLAPYLAGPPKVSDFEVGASTTSEITGWKI